MNMRQRAGFFSSWKGIPGMKENHNNMKYLGEDPKDEERAKLTHFAVRRTGLRLKGLNPILSSALVFLVVVIAIAVILNISGEAVEASKKSSSIRDANSAMLIIGNAVKEVAAEGYGAKRSLKLSYSGRMESIPGEDAVQFDSEAGPQLFDYLSREFSGNTVKIAGGDVSCNDLANLTMENTFLKVQMKKIPRSSAINTTDILISLKEKTNSTEVIFSNSSVAIDGNLSTVNGTGYSEISWKGQNMPFCQAHAFVNSTKSYDVYYRLYAGADFLVIDVRNIKDK